MNIMKLQLKWASRIEFIGSGFYMSLAGRYRKNKDIAETLAVFSKDEYRHGLMFRKGLNDEYGASVMTGPWTFLGKTLAWLQYLIPLRWKLKNLSVLESVALKLMDKELQAGTTNRYRTILKKIQPDEIRHATWYDLLYGKTVSQEL